jgi:hypothetical protein
MSVFLEMGIANLMKINISKTRVISFARKRQIAFECKLYGYPVNRANTAEDLGVFLNSKLYFRQLYFVYCWLLTLDVRQPQMSLLKIATYLINISYFKVTIFSASSLMCVLVTSSIIV